MNQRFLTGLCLALSGLGLMACTTTAPAPTLIAEVAPVVPPAAAPQPIAGFDWFLNTDGRESSLAYGMANSDDIRVSLDCRHNSRSVNVMVPAPSGAEPVILLESGGETERLRATSEPSDLFDGDLLVAEAATNSPLFQRFGDVGWLAVWEQGDRHTYVPHPGAQDYARQFLAKCG